MTGAWWDLVDPVATGRIGPLVLTFPREVGGAMRAWARSDDPWERRAAICQVTARKGIGWMLREHAETDP